MDVPSVADVWRWATSPAAVPGGFSCHQCTAGKGYWRQEAHAIVWRFMYLITRPSKLLVDGCCDYITAAA